MDGGGQRKKAWAKMKEAEIKGEKPIYWPRTWREKERREEKRNKVRGWYKKGGFDSKMFVPATPGAELKKRVEKEMEGTGVRVKIVEKPGEKLIKI